MFRRSSAVLRSCTEFPVSTKMTAAFEIKIDEPMVVMQSMKIAFAKMVCPLLFLTKSAFNRYIRKWFLQAMAEKDVSL
jgi:hypothetical protein